MSDNEKTTIKAHNPSVLDRVRAQAQNEVAQELTVKLVKQYKAKLRELSAAKTVVANIEREIKDLELAIEHGNV